MGGSDFLDAAKDVQQLSERIEDDVDNQLETAALTLKGDVKRTLATNGQVYTSALANSIHHRETAPDGAMTSTENLVTDTYSTHIVTAAAPYAAYVEYGTGVNQRGSPRFNPSFPSPSSPPYAAIREWARDQQIQPRNDNFRRPDGTVDYDSLSAAIAESIASEGTEAHPYMRPAWIRHERSLRTAHKNGLKTALRRTF